MLLVNCDESCPGCDHQNNEVIYLVHRAFSPITGHHERISFQEYYVQVEVLFIKPVLQLAQYTGSKMCSKDDIIRDMICFSKEMWLFFKNKKFN